MHISEGDAYLKVQTKKKGMVWKKIKFENWDESYYPEKIKNHYKGDFVNE